MHGVSKERKIAEESAAQRKGFAMGEIGKTFGINNNECIWLQYESRSDGKTCDVRLAKQRACTRVLLCTSFDQTLDKQCVQHKLLQLTFVEYLLERIRQA